MAIVGEAPPRRSRLSSADDNDSSVCLNRNHACLADASVRGKLHLESPSRHEITPHELPAFAARIAGIDPQDKVCNDHEPVIITRNRKRAVVMMSLEDYSALEETACLTRSPANARHLLESIAGLKAGKVVKKKLSDLVDE